VVCGIVTILELLFASTWPEWLASASAAPTAKDCAEDTAPEETAEPPTMMEAPVSVLMGVTVTNDTLFGTLKVYDVVPLAKAGVKVPALTTRLPSVLTVLSAAGRVTVTE
jgi:hypothetical protein